MQVVVPLCFVLLNHDFKSLAAILTQFPFLPNIPLPQLQQAQLLEQLCYEWDQRKHCKVLNIPYLVCSAHISEYASNTDTDNAVNHLVP